MKWLHQISNATSYCETITSLQGTNVSEFYG